MTLQSQKGKAIRTALDASHQGHRTHFSNPWGPGTHASTLTLPQCIPIPESAKRLYAAVTYLTKKGPHLCQSLWFPFQIPTSSVYEGCTMMLKGRSRILSITGIKVIGHSSRATETCSCIHHVERAQCAWEIWQCLDGSVKAWTFPSRSWSRPSILVRVQNCWPAEIWSAFFPTWVLWCLCNHDLWEPWWVI